MTTQDDNREIRDALRELPAMAAPPGFTEGVLRRLETTEARSTHRGAWGSPRLAFAATALAVALTAGLWLWMGTASDTPTLTTHSALDQLDELRREHELLRRDLESLREVTRSDSPYLYLGGDESVDYVWGLEPGLGEPTGPTDTAIRPASASF